ncbi:MAG: hypothetical protein K0R93_993 [Anaerosolibacter sp.]|jgi:hypothetical protein|uniref:hypothetical protein n=1 Tax=Anaerosolibacter sp. TaxID=1872527 RepID=UPI00260AEB14|nr:hypothetical protein [Anaerosolibacter sp.]MDF2546095.1 hypothetical protein [Anaerosolibacter sp.]
MTNDALERAKEGSVEILLKTRYQFWFLLSLLLTAFFRCQFPLEMEQIVSHFQTLFSSYVLKLITVELNTLIAIIKFLKFVYLIGYVLCFICIFSLFFEKIFHKNTMKSLFEVFFDRMVILPVNIIVTVLLVNFICQDKDNRIVVSNLFNMIFNEGGIAIFLILMTLGLYVFGLVMHILNVNKDN